MVRILMMRISDTYGCKGKAKKEAKNLSTFKENYDARSCSFLYCFKL